ncbi:hypothetical protein BaRGS_00021962 [Batillaria attramentaria]|uniref:ASCH domain-containing protein n=1 Tax=Batillaria attramentaria TaxID=370345 RepID=A0ABD0KIG4_9CAEN
MAVSLEQWFCSELSKLGIDATEDSAKYILSMEDAADLEEYMLGLLDGTDPAVRSFLPELMERWHASGGKPPPNAMAYRKNKESEVYVQGKTKKKKDKSKTGTSGSASESSSDTAVSQNGSVKGPTSAASETHFILFKVQSFPGADDTGTQDGGFIGIGARKKNKFVPLYSQEGKEKLVIKLPGRSQCECQALKHKLINNCTNCGRVVCEQEGAGPCLFCGRLVCSPEDQDVLSRGSKKSEKLRQHLMRDADKFTPLCRGGGEREVLPSISTRMQEGLDKAKKHKDRLIEYDRTSVRRTQVIDDECDYFSTDSNQWLSKQDREALRKREEELRSARHGSRRDRKVTLDFAGRRVVEEDNVVGKTMYDRSDAVIQQVHYRPNAVEGKGSETGSGGDLFLVNPSIVQPAPKPWASLLVAGIKVHEGRSWYTAHRGRLWIAATAKSPPAQEVAEMEDHYRFFLKDPNLEFPRDYPVGCLLGCVDLVDCLSQEEYRQKFPDGESASPYVFICENPQELVIKFPIKGKHKIYKLDSAIHQAAKKGLR